MLTYLYFQTLLLKYLQFDRFDDPILINIFRITQYSKAIRKNSS